MMIFISLPWWTVHGNLINNQDKVLLKEDGLMPNQELPKTITFSIDQIQLPKKLRIQILNWTPPKNNSKPISELELLLEVLEDSWESPRNSRLLMIMEMDYSMSKSSRKPCTISEWDSVQNKSMMPLKCSTETVVVKSPTTSSWDQSEDHWTRFVPLSAWKPSILWTLINLVI